MACSKLVLGKVRLRRLRVDRVDGFEFEAARFFALIISILFRMGDQKVLLGVIWEKKLVLR